MTGRRVGRMRNRSTAELWRASEWLAGRQRGTEHPADPWALNVSAPHDTSPTAGVPPSIRSQTCIPRLQRTHLMLAYTVFRTA